MHWPFYPGLPLLCPTPLAWCDGRASGTARHCTFLVHQGNLGASGKLGIALGQGLSLELPEEEFLVDGRDAKA